MTSIHEELVSIKPVAVGPGTYLQAIYVKLFDTSVSTKVHVDLVYQL